MEYENSEGLDLYQRMASLLRLLFNLSRSVNPFPILSDYELPLQATFSPRDTERCGVTGTRRGEGPSDTLGTML